MAAGVLGQRVHFSRFDTDSFPDAKSRENAIEQVIGVDRADHGADLIQRESQFQGQKLGRVVEECN